MNKVTKIMAGIIFALMVCLPTYALAAGQQDDPCQEFAGKWSGAWLHNQYRFGMTVDAVMYGQEVQMIVKLHNGESFSITGTCKDSVLDLVAHKPGDMKMTGRVFGNTMSFESTDKSRTAYATKEV